MRDLPPVNFNLSELLKGIYIFQRWEVFPGIFTEGPKDVAQNVQRLGIPESLTGMRVLDIAPWNGFFSFECVRRGAKEVVSLGPDDPDKTGYNKVRQMLEIDNVRYLRESVYDLSPARHGTFDIVLFLGLIYHLRYPLLALDKIYDVAVRRLYVDSPLIDNHVYDLTVSVEVKQEILTEGHIAHQLPLAYFTKNAETGDGYNWFLPNLRAFHAFVESSGFNIVGAQHEGDWAWLAAEKAERQFQFGVEGWNPDAAMFAPNN